MRVLKGAARACGRFMRQITPSGNTSKVRYEVWRPAAKATTLMFSEDARIRENCPNADKCSSSLLQITRRSSQVRGRSHVKSPVVCSDDLKIGQGELRHPATALLRTRAYPFSQPLPAIPQPLHEASLVSLGPCYSVLIEFCKTSYLATHLNSVDFALPTYRCSRTR